jgi:hypothetical protein
MPGSVNNPPVIESLTPRSSTVFNDAPAGITFEAVTVAPNQLLPGNITLVLNGVDVSADLAIGGTFTERTVAYDSLAPNQAYQAVITVSDNVGREASTTIVFDTFSFEGALFIEAEDYYYAGGQFVADPAPGAYAGLEGVPRVDYQDVNVTTLATQYRTADYVGIAVTGDGLRPGFGAPGPNDYHVTSFLAGDWMNYTRNVPAGTYQIANKFYRIRRD